MLSFQKVTIEDVELLRKYLKKSGSRSCIYSVGNNIIWNYDNSLEFTILYDTLVYRVLTETEAIYRIPETNRYLKKIVELVCQEAKEIGKIFKIADMSKEMEKQLLQEFPGMFVTDYSRAYSDYVYEVEALTHLKGKKYHGKKNHINKFLRTYEFTYEPVTKENWQECWEMSEIWSKEKKAQKPEVAEDGNISGIPSDEPEPGQSMEAEKMALAAAFRYYERLEFVGGLIRVMGKVVAFTFGEEITEDTFVTHFEKAMDMPGLYPLINQQFSEHELQKYTYVNREEDLGLAGLRKAKQSYHPVFMLERIFAVKAEEQAVWDERREASGS